MIKCELKGRNFEVDDKLRAYAEDKIGGLEKYLPRQVRDSVSCTVTLEDDPNGREDNRYVCDAVLTIEGSTIVSQEGTVNIYAAVDIVEAKLKAQLSTYKAKRTSEPRRGRKLSEWLGRRKDVAAPAETDADGPVVN